MHATQAGDRQIADAIAAFILIALGGGALGSTGEKSPPELAHGQGGLGGEGVRSSLCGTDVTLLRAYMVDCVNARQAVLHWRLDMSDPFAPSVGVQHLTVAEVCAELKVSRSTFYYWRQTGKAPRCIVLPNREVRVRRIDLDEWLERRLDAA